MKRPMPARGVEARVGTGRPARVALRLCLGYWPSTSLVTALSVFDAALTVAVPIIAGLTVGAISERRDMTVIVTLAGFGAAVTCAAAVLRLVRGQAETALGQRIALDIRVALFDRIAQMPLSLFEEAGAGTLASRFSEIQGLEPLFGGTLSALVLSVVQVTLSVGAMIEISWQVGVLVLVSMPVFLHAASRTSRTVSALQDDLLDRRGLLINLVIDRFSASGAMMMKLFGDPAREIAGFTDRAERVRGLQVHVARVIRRLSLVLGLVPVIAQLLVYVVGGWLTLHERLSVGSVVAMGLLLMTMFGPLGALASLRVGIATGLVTLERVIAVLRARPSITERPDARGLAPGPVAVEFRDVRFRYTDEPAMSAFVDTVATVGPPTSVGGTSTGRSGVTVLDGIDMFIAPGRVLALVGPTGAGKSTIASMLCRLRDVSSGAVLLNGVDVRDLTGASLRATVGVVSQNCHLLNDSIAANLRYAKPGASDVQLWDAVGQAQLGDMIAALPDGLATVVGDSGHRLSGGERQRLSIARLFLTMPQVIVLDEATAHLDSRTELAIRSALEEVFCGRTILVIAHRLSTVRAADEILVIDGGKVAERGRHAELLANDGMYAELCRAQFFDAHAGTGAAVAPSGVG